MNLLAHAHLGSKLENKINCVNILWDFIAKDLKDNSRNFIVAGMKLHNTIDFLTDTSDEYKKAKQLVSPKRKKIAGIIIDIGFDYVLSKNWQMYSDTDISEFINKILIDLSLYSSGFSKKAKTVQEHICKYDWFGDYMDIDRIPMVFNRISTRLPAKGLFKNADDEIKNNLPYIEKLFHSLYKKIIAEISKLKL
ncbi:MAG TPA: ACP phosphodiesterase [Victivallales bacterium]|nr:ACP phosphodiesterase [Victivallales bacterium]